MGLRGWILHIFKEEHHGTPEQKPGNGHEPPRAREPVENEPVSVRPKSNLVKQSSKKRAERETSSLPDDEIRSEGCPPAGSNNPWIRAVLLHIHGGSERYAQDHAPDENQVETVGLEGEGITKVPNDRRETANVKWDLITS